MIRAPAIPVATSFLPRRSVPVIIASMRIFSLGFLVIGFVALCGCEHFLFNPHFKVEESGLNWVDIRRYDFKTSPVNRVNVRLDGNGFVVVREGTSMLVNNPFANTTEDGTWNDLRETRITLTREEMVPLFQLLVDNGLFEERRLEKGQSSTNEAIFVSANIGGKTCGSEDDVYLCDPDLAEHLKTVLLMFYHPQPRQRR